MSELVNELYSIAEAENIIPENHPCWIAADRIQELEAEAARLISVVEGWEAWKQSMENYSHAYYERAEAAEAEVERLKQLLREYNEQIVTQEISVLTESQSKVCTPDPKHK